jgi:hypothetical protein
MTGRGAGYCAGYATPGFANPGFGMGRGMGMRRGFRGGGLGRGFGRGRSFAMAPVQEPVEVAPEMQKAYLRNELELLRANAEAIERQLSAMDRGEGESPSPGDQQ